MESLPIPWPRLAEDREKTTNATFFKKIHLAMEVTISPGN